MESENAGVETVVEEVDLDRDITAEEMAELSEDDLDAAVTADEEVVKSGAEAESEEVAESEETSEEKSPVKEKSKESDESEKVSPEKKAEESTGEEAEKSTEEKSKEETKAESKEKSTDDGLAERLASAEKRLEDQDKYIRRRDTEVGELRKQVRKSLDAPKGETEEVGDDELITRADARAEAEAEKERALALQELDGLERTDADDENRVAVKEAIPDLDDLVDDIAEVALKDGTDQEYIDAFKKDPASFDKKVILVYANRAREQRERNELRARLDVIEGKTAAAKTGAVDAVNKKIDAATKGSKSKVTSATGGTSPNSKEISPSQIHELSDEALDRAIKEGQE